MKLFRKRYFPLPLIIILLTMTFHSCDELLPPRQDPSAVFEAELYDARYVLLAAFIPQNYVQAKYRFKNVYDETLQGTTQFKGKIELILKRDPAIRKIDSLNVANLFLSQSYNIQTHVLTIDPGSYAYFEYRWDPRNPVDSSLRYQMFRYAVDNTCRFPSVDTTTGDTTWIYLRSIAERETFVLLGEIKVFDQTAPVRFGPLELSFCHVTAAIDESACPLPVCNNP